MDSAVQAVAAGEVEKWAQYLTVCRQHGWAFEPFNLSPLGWLGPAGRKIIKALMLGYQVQAHEAKDRMNEDSPVFQRIWGSLSYEAH